jgi:hypothetical protein
VGGFADPKDFFLNLSHSLESNFDTQIASRHHYGDHRSGHRGQQNPRKRLDRESVLDLQNNSGFCRLKAIEFFN